MSACVIRLTSSRVGDSVLFHSSTYLHTSSGETSEPFGLVHPGVHILFRALWLTIIITVAGLGVLVWRLSQGPLSLDFLTSYAEQQVDVASGALTFRLGSASLSWSEFRSIPRVQARDVTVISSAGEVIAVLPDAWVEISVPDLFSGRVVPIRVSISEPIVQVTRFADGRVALGFDAVTASTDEQEETVASEGEADVAQADDDFAGQLISGLLGQSEDGQTSRLRQVSIRDSTVVFSDDGSARQWILPDASFELSRDDAGLNLSASLPVTSSGQVSDIEVVGRYARSSGNLSLSVGAVGLVPQQFADLAPQLDPLRALSAELDGDINASLLVDGNFVFINWLRFDLRSQEGELALPEPVDQTYAFSDFSLRGTAGRDLDRIIIEAVELALPGVGGETTTLSLNALASQLNSSPRVEAAIAAGSLTVEQLVALWPAEVKPNSRRWIERNLSDGSLYGLNAQFVFDGQDLASIELEDFGLQTGIDDLTVQYIRGLPPVRNTFAVMNMDTSELVISIGGGQVRDFNEADPLEVQSGSVTFLDLDKSGQTAVIDIVVDGALPDVLKLIDLDPLGYARATGIDPMDTAGQGSARLGMRFPLLADLKLEDIEFDVEAAFTEVSVLKAALDQDLTRGQLQLRVTGDGMLVSGPARLGGTDIGLTWEEYFVDGPYSSRISATASIPEDQRPVFGMSTAPLTPPYINGPLQAEAVYTIFEDGTADLVAEIDLTSSLLDFAELGWTKPLGAPGSAILNASLVDGVLRSIDEFQVSVPSGLSVEGTVLFDDAGALSRIDLPDAQVGESAFTLAYRAGPSDLLQVTGEAVDATRIWEALRRGSSPEGERVDPEDQERGLEVVVDVDQLWFDRDRPFRDVEARLVLENGRAIDLDFFADFGDEERIGARLISADDQRRLQIESSDAGATLSALGLYDDIVGGALQIEGLIDNDDAIQGTALISNYELVRAPVVARLLSVAALTGILDELNGRGISFQQLEIPFTYEDDLLSVTDAGAYGNSIGLTATGEIGLGSGNIDVQGTLVPAYAVNSALGNIPVVGPLFSGGEKGSGLFAANYSISGTANGAEISVNPLSALAPGFLRRLFRAPAQSAEQAESGVEAQSSP